MKPLQGCLQEGLLMIRVAHGMIPAGLDDQFLGFARVFVYFLGVAHRNDIVGLPVDD